MTTRISSSLLANTAVSPGSYGSPTAYPVITVDQQGRVTSAINQTVTTSTNQTTFGVTYAYDYFSGDNTTTTFNLTRSITGSNTISVMVSGLEQSPNNWTTTSSTITFSTPPGNQYANNIIIKYLVQPGAVALIDTTSDTSNASIGRAATPLAVNTVFSYAQAGFATANTVVANTKILTTPGTSGNILTSNGTSWTSAASALPSPGTSGNVLQSNGTSWTSVASSALPGVLGQAFTTNGTFTIPSGVTAIKATVVGGGGGGKTGAAGAGGGTAISYLTSLTPGNTLAVTIGGGGSGASTGTGGTGGTSQVASGTQTISTISASGGGGGYIGGPYIDSSGGTGSGGTINIGGGAGGRNSPGGSSTLGGGGASSLYDATAGSGRNYGAGGGSAGTYTPCGSPTSNGTGGAGAGGVVIFEW